MRTDKNFPNGFTSWIETHHEIVMYITRKLQESADDVINSVMNTRGTGGIYELAEDWTDEFEEQNTDREWDGEFHDEIDFFCYTKNHNNNGNDAQS